MSWQSPYLVTPGPAAPPQPPAACNFLNYLFKPWLLPVAWSWLWDQKLAGARAAWYHRQSREDLGEDWDWAPLIPSSCSLAMKAWRAEMHYLPPPRCGFSATVG